MNLTNTAKWFKKFTFYLGGFVIFYYLLILVFIPSIKATIAIIIPDKNPPTIKYGVLPSLEFSTKAINGTPKFELNTANGKLPTELPTRAKVFKVKQMLFSYNAGKSAQDNAAYFGYSDSDLITDLKGKVYKWRSLQSGGTLEIDIDSKKLLMSSPLSGKSSIYKVGFHTDTSALKATTDMLTSIGRFDDLYVSGTNTINKGKYVNNKLIKTEDRADAQLYRIDFFRNIEKFKIVGPDPTKGLLHAYIGNEVNAPNNLKITPSTFPIMELYYNEIDVNSEATYPLLNISAAWNAVKQGKGIIANVTPKGNNPFVENETITVQDILINNISLAYYETPQSQKYLQPIYVFEGNYKTTGTQGGNIVIYFPAIAGEYIQAVSN